MLYKFEKQDIQTNILQLNPEIFYEFSDISSDSYLNKNSFTSKNLSNSSINLYEYNIDRDTEEKIYPFIYRNNDNNVLDIDDDTYNNTEVGEVVEGNYDQNIGINYIFYDNTEKYKYLSLRNKLLNMRLDNDIINQKDGILSSDSDYYFPAFFLDRDIYGSKIKEKSISIKMEINITNATTDLDLDDGYYIIEACDYFGDGKLYTKNSDMYYNFPSNQEYVHVGYVFYSLGLICFHNNTLRFGENGNMKTSVVGRKYTWKTYGHLLSSDEVGKRQVKFTIKCNGTNNLPNINIFCKAYKNHLNHSNNLTSIESNQDIDNIYKSLFTFYENDNLSIKNMASDSLLSRTHALYEGDTSDLNDMSIDKFEKTTYISSINLYDENYNLIGISKLSNPIKKREIDEFIFKIKVDI